MSDLSAMSKLQPSLVSTVIFSAASAGGDWQGVSKAEWELAIPGGYGARAGNGKRPGSLKVSTSKLKAGYLRKNGVPYSDRTTLTEHFDVTLLADGSRLLLVTTIVEDPVYLTGPYVVSPHFKKEPDGSKWDPTPCSSSW